MSDVNSNLETLFNKMETFVSSKTVVGEPIHIGEIVIIPLVDISVGVGSGASNKNDDKNGKNGAAGGLGAKITPSAMLVIQNGTVQMISVRNSSSINKIIDMVPGFISDLNLGSVFNKKNNRENDNSSEDTPISEP